MRVLIEKLAEGGFLAQAHYVKNPKDGNHRGGLTDLGNTAEIGKNGIFQIGIASNRGDYEFPILATILIDGKTVLTSHAEEGMPKIRVSVLTS